MSIMNKYILTVFLLFSSLSVANANTWASTAIWTAASGIVNCGTSTSHWLVHHWVPSSNNSSAWTLWWVIACLTHTYYSTPAWVYTVSVSWNNWGITWCNAWDRAISISPAWCTSGSCTMTCWRYDDVPPTALDVTNSNNANLEATNSYNYDYSIFINWWAPIRDISWTKENTINQSTSPYTANSLPFGTTWDIRNVDNYRNKDWSTAREYSITLNEICDEAWNCWNWVISNNHNVYANSSNVSIEEVNNSHVLDLEDNDNIANGSNYPFTITLIDQWWNEIIPANWINREIDFNFDVSNSTKLDHYKLTWDAIYLNTPDSLATFSNRLSASSSFNDQSSPSSNGVYPFTFRVYNPTFNADPDSVWNFTINNVTYDINQTDFANITAKSLNNSNNINFRFGPLYTTTFSWQQVSDWFIVWPTQIWTLTLNWTWTPDMFLEYWYYDPNVPNHRPHPVLDMDFLDWWTWTKLLEWEQVSAINLEKFWTATWPLYTQVFQDWTLSVENQKTYLSSHISYTLDGNPVVYNSDVIWMDTYWGTAIGTDNTHQKWILINWLTHSGKQNELVIGDDPNYYAVLWNLDKSSLQRDIRKNTYWLIRNVSTSNGWWVITTLDFTANTDWAKLWDILYFWWTDVTINASNYSWNKTIVVVWWNLYITNDIIANNKANDILWIIVLKDDAWNWGNIYVDPSVLEIDSILYADKALVSYDWSSEISPDNGWTYSVLSNQLYVHGSLFSNNTIWWSVNVSSLECPFYITSCDLDTAQKFDLNYLRRGFDSKYSWAYWDYPIIINYNPLVQTTPPPLFSK